MSNNNGIITPPLNVESDLGYVLGTGSGDSGTNCAASSVNPWAVYKPVASAGFAPISRDTLLHLGLGNDSRVEGPPHATTVAQFLDFYAESNTLGGKPANGWRWLYPRGLETYNEPYRLYDFLRYTAGGGLANSNGYNHNASNPFGKFDCTDRVVRKGGQFVASNSRFLPETNVPDTDITIGNINSYLGNASKMLYYGVLLAPSNTSLAYKIIGNSETRIDDGMSYAGHEDMTLEEFTLAADAYPEGTSTWTAYPFLTNLPFPEGNQISPIAYSARNNTLPDSRWLFPLPGSVSKTVIVYDDQLTINVYASTATHAYKTNIYFEIENNYPSTAEISGFMLKLRGTRGYSESRVSGEVFYDENFVYDDSGTPHGYNIPALSAMLSSLTVASGATVRVPTSGTVNFQLPSFTNTKLYIGCNYNGSDHYGYTLVKVPAGANFE